VRISLVSYSRITAITVKLLELLLSSEINLSSHDRLCGQKHLYLQEMDNLQRL
jgi:hypothetical protein